MNNHHKLFSTILLDFALIFKEWVLNSNTLSLSNLKYL